MPKGDKLSPKQVKFVKEYLVDLNATQAAIRAKYSKKTAAFIGHENLRKPKIQEALRERREKIEQEARKTGKIATPEEVLEGITRLMRFDPRKLYEAGQLVDIDKLDDDTALALAGFKLKESIQEADGGQSTILNRWSEYKFPAKEKSHEQLARHYGLFEKDNTQGPDAVLRLDDKTREMFEKLAKRVAEKEYAD